MTRHRWSAWAPDGRTVVPMRAWPVADGYAKGWTPERIERQREHGRKHGAKAARARWDNRKRADRAVIAGLATILVAQWAAFLRWHGGGL